MINVYGARIKSGSLIKEGTKEYELLKSKGTRRGFSWKPADGTIVTFDDDWFSLDTETIAIFGELESGEVKLFTIPMLCRQCDNTQGTIRDRQSRGLLCESPEIEQLLTYGMDDIWRAKQLYGRTFRISVFTVQKTDKVWDESTKSFKDKLDAENKPVTYEATMIWLDDEIEEDMPENLPEDQSFSTLVPGIALNQDTFFDNTEAETRCRETPRLCRITSAY